MPRVQLAHIVLVCDIIDIQLHRHMLVDLISGHGIKGPVAFRHQWRSAGILRETLGLVERTRADIQTILEAVIGA